MAAACINLHGRLGICYDPGSVWVQGQGPEEDREARLRVWTRQVKTGNYKTLRSPRQGGVQGVGRALYR